MKIERLRLLKSMQAGVKSMIELFIFVRASF